MINKMNKIVSLLRRVDCGNNKIYLKNKKIVCDACTREYIYQNGILNCLPKKLSSTQLIAIKTWGKDYSHILKEKYIIFNDVYGLKDVELIQKYSSNFNSKKFLELGCGKGRVSVMIAKKNADVYCVDICIEALKASQKLFKQEHQRGVFICADLENLPFKENIFDIIFGGGSIEHIKDTHKAVSGFYRVTKPKGINIFTVPFTSLSTLSQGIITGSIPDSKILGSFYYFIHFVLLRGKFALYGYEKNFSQVSLNNLFKNNKFKKITISLYDVTYTLKFIPSYFKKYILKLIKNKFFWPMVCVKVEK
ncbi:MAG: class I SAM-dependent methyltransferase [Nanoarchaeota archaeon]|nr:class I SAM-dependent methyltransferase [Nanoarchaeota archaeon]